MKISYNWLKDYLDIDLSPEELAEQITNAGLEVEEIITTVQALNNVVVGKILSCEKHPDADKLSICKVSDGEEEFPVICGAPNVAVGQSIPFAKVGARLPVGLKIKKAKIRGVESMGMICSREELALEDHSNGIWALENAPAPGTDFNEVLKEHSDVIFDLFITANRADCFSHIGIAREIAAFVDKAIRLPEVTVKENATKKITEALSVDIEYSAGCPRYAARVIENVSIGESPEWLRERLEAVGLRPINNVVDVTNYVLYELGQPLHAFDYDTIAGSRIIVRSSKAGETFVTLDDKERTLPENTVMICDAEKAVAIGGIMGGQNSEVSSKTTTILLESAYFDPRHIITSSRKLGLMTDASQRFEKGTDYANVIFALDRAAAMIAELAGGDILKGHLDAYPHPVAPVTVELDLSRVNKILGSALEDAEIIELLSRVQLNFDKGRVSVPSYRHDIKLDIDLIEEVARLKNYDNLPTSVYEPLSLEQPVRLREVTFRLLRDALTHVGLQEVFTNSMISEKQLIALEEKEPVKILNPISDDLAFMRQSIYSGLLPVVSYNVNRHQNMIRLFEIGRVFNRSKEELPEQPTRIAIVLSGLRAPQNWTVGEEAVDFYDLKGVLEGFFNEIHLDNIRFILYSESSLYQKHHAAEIFYGNIKVGSCGLFSKETCKRFGINQAVYGAELDYDVIEKSLNRELKYQTIPRFPYIEKDVAFVVDKTMTAEEVMSLIRKYGGRLLTDIEVFDVYEGEKIASGKKSIAFRLRFQSLERTLKDSEVEQVFRKIIKKADQVHGIPIRDQ